VKCREGPGDYYASRWSAAGGIDRLPQKPFQEGNTGGLSCLPLVGSPMQG